MAEEQKIPLRHLDDCVLPQISRVLQAAGEHRSRPVYPKLWNIHDRLDARPKGSATERRRRRIYRSVLSYLNWFLGLFLLLPGLMEPQELLVPLIVGFLVWLIGVGGLLVLQRIPLVVLSFLLCAVLTFGGIANTAQLGSMLIPGILSLLAAIVGLTVFKAPPYDRAAREVLERQNNITAEAEIVFNADGMVLPDGTLFPYSQMEALYVTEDLLTVIYNERMLMLPVPEDLSLFPEDLVHRI